MASYFTLESRLSEINGGRLKTIFSKNHNFLNVFDKNSKFKDLSHNGKSTSYLDYDLGVSERVSLPELEKIVERTTIISPLIKGFLNNEHDRFYEKAKFLFSTIHEKDVISFFDINSKLSCEIGEKSTQSENLFYFYRSLYEASNLQSLHKQSEIPISVDFFPKSMKETIILLCEKLYGNDKVKLTEAKDFDYLSVSDSIGRAVVIVFSDLNDLYVPTTSQIFNYETTIRDFLRNQMAPNNVDSSQTKIMNRDYDYAGHSFFDMTYGIRIIMVAINSIKNKKIELIDEKISFHSLREVISKYPLLTDVANGLKSFDDCIEELMRIAKILQNEYDSRNFNKLNNYVIYSNNNGFEKAVLDELRKNGYNNIIGSQLTKEDIEYKEEHHVGKPSVNLGFNDTINTKIDEMKSDFIAEFFGRIEQYSMDVQSDNINEFVSKISEFLAKSEMMPYLLHTIDLDGISFLHQDNSFESFKRIKDVDYNRVDLQYIINAIFEKNVDDSIPSCVIVFLSNLVAEYTNNYLCKIADLKSENSQGEVKYEFNKFVQKVFAIKLALNNKKALNRFANMIRFTKEELDGLIYLINSVNRDFKNKHKIIRLIQDKLGLKTYESFCLDVNKMSPDGAERAFSGLYSEALNCISLLIPHELMEYYETQKSSFDGSFSQL